MASTSKRIRTDDPNFAEVVQRWWREVDEDNSDAETDENIHIDSDHDTESEQELDEDTDEENLEQPETDDESSSETEDQDEEQPTTQHEKAYFYGKNRFKWSKVEPTRNVRVSAHNIIRLPHSRLNAEDVDNPISSFHRLFTAEMYQLIIKWTNMKLSKMRCHYKRQDKPELADLTLIELQAFLGLLLYSAVFKSNH